MAIPYEYLAYDRFQKGVKIGVYKKPNIKEWSHTNIRIKLVEFPLESIDLKTFFPKVSIQYPNG